MQFHSMFLDTNTHYAHQSPTAFVIADPKRVSAIKNGLSARISRDWRTD